MKFKNDFMVIHKAKYFSVHGRRSFFENGEWHWIDGWHVSNYKTRERAQAEADRLNALIGAEFTADLAQIIGSEVDQKQPWSAHI